MKRTACLENRQSRGAVQPMNCLVGWLPGVRWPCYYGLRMTYVLHEICSDDQFGDVRAEWNALLGESRSNTIFLTWEWLHEWWRSYGAGRSPRILLLRDGNGQPAGALPLMSDVVRAGPFGRVRALRFLGDGSFDSDYLDALCRPGEENGVVRAIFDHLDAVRDWDVIFLNEIPADSPHLPLLTSECERHGYAVSESRGSCAYTPLPANWDAFVAMLKPRFRTKVRAMLRAVGDAGGEAMQYCRDESELDAWLETLFDLHTRRWRVLGQDGVFGHPGKQEFYRRMGRRFLDRGWLRFSRLTVAGCVVAMQFCFEYDNRMFLLQEGFDPDCADRDAGNTLRALVFADSIRRGVAVYDFLGGVSQHKLNWAAQVKESVRLTLTRPNLSGRAYRLATEGPEKFKQAVRVVVPDSVIRMGKRLLRRDAKP